jgi:hypothetical protein
MSLQDEILNFTSEHANIIHETVQNMYSSAIFSPFLFGFFIAICSPIFSLLFYTCFYVVSSLVYLNLLGNKRLSGCYCCCENTKDTKSKERSQRNTQKKQDEELSEVTWLVTYLFRVPTKQLLASLLFFFFESFYGR